MRDFLPSELALALSVLFLVAGCTGDATPTGPDAHLLTTAYAGVGPVDRGKAEAATVCHVLGNGGYLLLEVNGNAVPAHLAHGDGQPGDPYPGMEGYDFGDDCQAVDNGEGDAEGDEAGETGMGDGGDDEVDPFP